MKERGLKKKQEEEGGASWLCTFNDLMTLLMVFFVLIFSLSTIDVDKASGMIGSLQSGLGVLEEGTHVDISIIDPQPSIQTLENEMGNLSEVYTQILEDLAETEKEPIYDDQIENAINYLPNKKMGGVEVIPGVSAAYKADGIYITLSDHLFFNSGSADINTSAYSSLDHVIESIKKTNYSMRIEGHTDDIPIHTKKYPSNWELSTDRAIHVLKYFIKHGNISPTKLSAVGYGDSKPLVSNDSAENRSKNRRVEVVLYRRGNV